MEKRFSVLMCVVLFAFVGCGTPATRDAGIVPDTQATATPALTPLVTALVTAAPGSTTASPATPAIRAVTPAPATQAPATVAAATAAPTVKPVGVAFTSVRSPVSRNGTGLAAVSTAPNISCSIVVTYKSGPSSAQGLVPKTSDAAGAVSWTWNIGAATTLGTWPIDVTCGSARAHATFVVQ
ncbi:MAG: hypothetical protein M3T56_07550 [Chloroflexota bacterium]|nr:hypothetical protein [Chloroflexota bacterium]